MAETINENEEIISKPKKRSKVFLIVLILLVVAGGWFGFSKYLHAQKHEETDDAQIEANISPVIPRVGGYVKEVRVSDNQVVKKGDTLMLLDDRDLSLRVMQAEAALATAQSNLGQAESVTNASRSNIASAQSSVGTIDAQIDAAKVNVWRTANDFQRYSNLIKDHSVTQQQYEQSLAAKETAEKQLAILQQQKNQAQQQTNAVASQSNATSSQINVAGSVIKQREVEVAEAKLNLSYAAVIAQEGGMVSKVNVQPGQFVQPGQPLFSIVISKDTWVIANFKETQLSKMKLGQLVTIHADAYPDHSFEAKVTSFSPATGSRFALLPPDNASGNFVKVVQRLPVKIEFANPADSLIRNLRAGMNVSVDVHIK
jgi:membrane fusion protein (multidrug efflux system)